MRRTSHLALQPSCSLKQLLLSYPGSSRLVGEGCHMMSSRATQVARNGIANRMKGRKVASMVILTLYVRSSITRLALSWVRKW